MKHYPLIVFDWDGTLIDSIKRIATSLQHASKVSAGISVSEQQAKNVIGLGLNEAISTLHPTLKESYIEPMANAYRQHFNYENTIASPLFPGVRECLQTLVDNNFILAIATGKSRHGLELNIAEHDVAHFFTSTRCADENLSKPHPEMLLSILDELKFTPAQTLMVGDSEHDLQMANNAKVDSVGVTHGVHTLETLLQFKPLYCLDDVTGLPERLIKVKQR